jgi:hypothetical protein
MATRGKLSGEKGDDVRKQKELDDKLSAHLLMQAVDHVLEGNAAEGWHNGELPQLVRECRDLFA